MIAALLLAAATAAPVNLICTGTALKDETVGGALDLMSGNGRTERIASEDSVTFALAGEGGTARVPRRLQSAYKERNADGSFNLVKVATSDNEITGMVRIHAMNKLKFRLDRLSGVVTIDGPLANFSGRCEPYDPATVVRKF
jgi:hypothetical protein